ncbi:MAG: hypothetical protein VX252_00350, partial [Myxococcota bacterium]|nr:hypothetical protein [Myxococcota bacterium]
MTQDNQVGSGGGRLEIQTARSRLEEAAQTLRKRPRQDLIAALGELLDRFQDGESSWHEALLAKTVKTSGFSRATVAAGLELALKDWTHSSLTAMVEQELGSLSRNTGPPPSGCSVTSLILAGVIPMPNLLNTLLPLLVGSPVLVKPSSRDPHTPELVARCLSDIDPQW